LKVVLAGWIHAFQSITGFYLVVVIRSHFFLKMVN